MKKILTFLVLAVASIAAHAEYLYWQAPTTTPDGISSYSYATLWTSTDNTSYTVINDNGTTLYFDATTANDTDVGSAQYFYIELVNYADSSYTVVGRSEVATYDSLISAGALHSDLATNLSKMTAWVGSSYSAVPEPTSGLLMLMGFAMLGLKRKKEV